MKNAQNPYTVRLDGKLNDETLRKFALAVSDALTRLSKIAAKSTVVQGESVQGSTASWALALYDEVTGLIAFLPGVRFVPVGADDVNIGFELDVSPRVGSGIGGTSQGYMANYGTVGGSKLAAGMSANNEDPNIPRLDLGFKPKRGATLEFYGSDGDTDNTRRGQLRATLGPGGQLIISRYVSGDRWEVIGGFGENGEMICGWRNTGWPGSGDTWGTTVAPPAVLNVYGQTGGIGSEAAYTKLPVATIDKDGVVGGTKLKLNNGEHSVTLNPTGFTGALTLTLQQKTFVGDAAPSWVLCAAV
jgi:hypothetical protein